MDQAYRAEEDMKARQAWWTMQGRHGRQPGQGTQDRWAGKSRYERQGRQVRAGQVRQEDRLGQAAEVRPGRKGREGFPR